MRLGISGFFWGRKDTGSGQYLHSLMPALLALGSDVEYRMLAPKSSPISKNISENLTKVWFEQISFPSICRREKVDVAHVPYFAPPLFPSVPTVVTIHDLIPFILPEYGRSARLTLYNWLIAQGAKRAAAIIVDSKATKNDLLCLSSIPEERIHVIYLAAGEDYRPAPVEDREMVRQKYGLPEKYLLYLGGFDQRKNLAALFKALALLPKSLAEWRLVIAGKVPEKDSGLFPDPRRLASGAGVEASVQFIGWAAEEDKLSLYNGAGIFLYPSLYEGFGLPPLEAMASGTPVIAANSSSLPEVVGQGGILIDPQDTSAWVEAIARLLENPEEREKWAAKGREQAQKFSWRKTAEETRAVYEELAKY